jgi:hypothetical protein
MQGKTFDELWEDASAEFANYVVTMGICKYSHTPKSTWWMELTNKERETCVCCEQVIQKDKKLGTYNNPTFESAINDIRTQIAKEV